VGALDPFKKIIYVYAEVEETLDDKPLDYIINKIKAVDNFPNRLLAFPHQCDPRGRNKDQISGQSWIDVYRERGIIFQTARDCEGNSLAPTIQKLYNYATHGRLKIFKTCKKIYNELSRYKYKERQTGDDANQGEKPQDKNNHLPDALRYMLSPFPQFPEDPSNFDDVWREMQIRQNLSTNYDYLSTNDEDSDFVVEYMDNFG
jgi:hypothetical protein